MGTSILAPPCEMSRVVTYSVPVGRLEQGRAGQLDPRHPPALAGLADDVVGDEREDVDLLVEAERRPPTPRDQAT